MFPIAVFEEYKILHDRCGAGAAGLCLAQKILEAQKNGILGPVEFVLFEKDDGVYVLLQKILCLFSCHRLHRDMVRGGKLFSPNLLPHLYA